ncbi:MAG: hypothetical protein EBQ92_13305 [Proteobacteria bacterium]|nr:hypothetical protein [Pseudomonadota bacterium]
MATTLTVEQIEEMCGHVFDCILSGTQIDPQTIHHILSARLINRIGDGINIARMITETVASLRVILTTELTQTVVAKVKNGKTEEFVQKEVRTTLNDLFNKIRGEHCHTTVKKGTTYGCDFHQESLFCHSVLACLFSLWNYYSENTIHDHRTARLIGATALFHDVGKLFTVSCTKIVDGDHTKNVTSFKGHALHGQLTLSSMYNEAFGFTFQEWESLCRAVGVHMCGYHDTDPNQNLNTRVKWSHLSFETLPVKEILQFLSVGDKLGAIPIPSIYNYENDLNFLDSRNKFKSFIQRDPISVQIGNHLILTITGRSASGKTHFIKNVLQPMFDQHGVRFIVVSRDDIMVKIASESLSIDVPADGNYDGELYSRCFNHSMQQSLGSIVNQRMRTMIGDAVLNGIVPIIDTVMGLNPRSYDLLFPRDAMANVEIVQIIVDRQIMITQADADRLGVSLQKQLEIRGIGLLGDSTAGQISSLMEKSSVERGQNNISQPTFVFTVVRTNAGTVGLKTVQDVLPKILMKIKDQPLSQDTSKMDGLEYLNHIYNSYIENFDENIPDEQKHILSLQSMINYFSALGFKMKLVRKDGTGTLYTIKYDENCNIWKPWARDFRAFFYRFVKCSSTKFSISPVKYQPPRGAEVLTGYHIIRNITSTENVYTQSGESLESTINGRFKYLDPDQQKICQSLMEGGNSKISGYLTGKGDGSLISITEYFGKEALRMTMFVMNSNDEFAKFILNFFMQHYERVIVISTQGTLMVGFDMWDYVATSLLDVTQIDRALYTDMTPYQAFSKFGSVALHEIGRMFVNMNTHDDIISRTMFFEAICSNRLTAWGTIHTELAVKYNDSMFLYLGYSECTPKGLFYHPHTENTVESTIFLQPPYWSFVKASDVTTIVQNLENVVFGKMTVNDFLKEHTPINWNQYEKIEGCIKLILHAEGFVMYTFKENGFPNYNKLKLPIYYEAHKWDIKNASNMILASKSEIARGMFPLVATVGEFYGSLETKLFNLWSYIYRLLNDSSEIQKIISGLDAKVKNSFETKADAERRARILFNNGKEFKTLIRMKLNEIFPLLTSTSAIDDDVLSTCARLATEFAFWNNPEVPENIGCFEEKVRSETNIISILFDHLMNQKVAS